MYKLEVIAFNTESCKTAQQVGAHRVELCANPGEGGTTPSYGFIKAAREILNIELYPIIRPRGGDFLYSDAELEAMKSDIEICRSLGCDGVVIGMLNKEGNIDKVRCSVLVNLAYPMGVTFHRAFDRVNDPQQALEDIIEIGCERILTSGLVPQAMDGAAMIAQLVKQAGGRIIIMPGSGVRADNIVSLAQQTGAVEFHSSARKNFPGEMSYNNQQMNEQLQTVGLDDGEVQQLLANLATI